MEISNAVHHHHHHQAMLLSIHGVEHHEEEQVVGSPKPDREEEEQKKMGRPNPEQALTCPRCESTNTKFCYYNNYSLSQPRYFCKGCRRYWTHGGSLRNVPIGGGCRKNNTKRSSSSSTSSSSSSSPSATAALKARQLEVEPPLPTFAYSPNDLTLAFNEYQKPAMNLGLNLQDNFLLGAAPSLSPLMAATTIPSPGFLDILRYRFLDPAVNMNVNGFPGLCYGEDEAVMLPFEGGGGLSLGDYDNGVGGGARTIHSSSSNTPAASNTPSSSRGMEAGGGGVTTQWDSHHDQEGSFMSVDQDYWNGMSSSSWHGLINTSLF